MIGNFMSDEAFNDFNKYDGMNIPRQIHTEFINSDYGHASAAPMASSIHKVKASK